MWMTLETRNDKEKKRGNCTDQMSLYEICPLYISYPEVEPVKERSLMEKEYGTGGTR